MKKLALCAGHHKERQGASNKNHDNLTEYVAASKVVAMAKPMLEAVGISVDLIDGKLSQKVRKVNEGKYDLALDYHFNADAELDDTDDTKGCGCMVMYCPGSTLRKNQASAMSKSIADSLGEVDRGGREGWYWGGENPGTIKDYFLRKTNCPAFIPEPGYIDNNGFVNKFLLDDAGHKKLAEALVKSVQEFFDGQ